MEQIPPIKALGKKFLAAALGGQNTPLHVKVTAAYANTTVIVSGDIAKTANISEVGGVYYFKIPKLKAAMITSSFPVLVLIFEQGADGLVDGDPFMAYLPPVEQFANGYVAATPSGFSGSRVDIFATYASKYGITVNGEAADVWTNIGSSGYLYYRRTVDVGSTIIINHSDPSKTFLGSLINTL